LPGLRDVLLRIAHPGAAIGEKCALLGEDDQAAPRFVRLGAAPSDPPTTSRADAASAAVLVIDGADHGRRVVHRTAPRNCRSAAAVTAAAPPRSGISFALHAGWCATSSGVRGAIRVPVGGGERPMEVSA
jgi:hypothetical protein